MSPHEAYHLACIVNSLLQITQNVARIRAQQLGLNNAVQTASNATKKQSKTNLTEVPNNFDEFNSPSNVPAGVDIQRQNIFTLDPSIEATHDIPNNKIIPFTDDINPKSSALVVEGRNDTVAENYELNNPSSRPTISEDIKGEANSLRSSPVPSSKLGRFFHYGGLAMSLAGGTVSSYLNHPSKTSNGSRILSDANIKRLVEKLSQMRGAALKLGQFMSIQDTHILSPELDQIFRRVQNSAHFMPNWQMERVLRSSFGPEFKSHFSHFESLPFAAASIGQVHAARLAQSSSPTGREESVVVKIQFPGVRESITSDLGILKSLLAANMFLPRGLYLDKTITAMREELAEECDYLREAASIRLFHSHLAGPLDIKRFQVPWVWEGSTKEVLVMQELKGVSLGQIVVSQYDQDTRDKLASRVIELCLRELFEWRVMQTDPNWSNFLWHAPTDRLQLLDFGATRHYKAEFMQLWLKLLQAAREEDRKGCAEVSLQLNYLTGEENETMLNAHVDSLMLLASPFRHSMEQPYAFGPGTDWARVTEEIRTKIPLMLRERLAPPPRETYSLNRKLSGAFLLASHLRAKVDCVALWKRIAMDPKASH